MKTNPYLFRAALVLALLLPAAAARADGDVRVGIVVEVTKEGKNVAPPTPQSPVYYEPLMLGYRQLGGVLTYYQEAPPASAQVGQSIANALAPVGYRIAPPTVPASIVLVCRWGVEDPEIHPIFSGQDQAVDRIDPVNEDNVLAIVVGERWYAIYPSINTNARELAANLYGKDGSRDFLIVSALDARAFSQHRQVRLWRAHITTPYWGHNLGQLLGPMIRAAAPYMGRKTETPVMISTDAGPL